MKKLELEIYDTPNQKGSYYLLIPPHQILYFSNKKEALKHVALLKKVLFDNISILSNLQSQLHSLYRSYYFQLSALLIEQLTFKLHSFDKEINFVFRIYNEGNQSWVFSKIQVLFNLLDDACNLLNGFAKSKNSHANLVRSINAISKQLTVFNSYYEKEIFSVNENLDNYRKKIKIIHLNKTITKNA